MFLSSYVSRPPNNATYDACLKCGYSFFCSFAWDTVSLQVLRMIDGGLAVLEKAFVACTASDYDRVSILVRLMLAVWLYALPLIFVVIPGFLTLLVDVSSVFIMSESVLHLSCHVPVLR